jgi:exonuclease VII small subunit
MTQNIDLNKNLSALTEIADWFDEQKEIDVEEGLKKVKAAAGLIKESRARLAQIENEFEVIKKEINEELASDIQSPSLI